MSTADDSPRDNRRFRRGRIAVRWLPLGIVTIVAVAGVTAAAFGRLQLATVLLLAAVAVGVVLILVSQRRAALRVATGIQRMEMRQRKDRSDASRWEWRLAAQVAALPGGGAPPGAGASVTFSNAEQVEHLHRLVGAGIFDAEFYGAVAGEAFATEGEAMRHFVTTGMPRSFSCTPLIDVEFLPAPVQAAWSRSDLGAVLAFLRSPRSALPPLSAYFRPSLLAVQTDATRRHPGGCVGWFVQHADDRTFLPVEDAAIRWGSFQSAVKAATAEHAESRELLKPRLSSSWDLDAEAEWKSKHRSRRTVDVRVEPLVSIVMPVWNRVNVVGDAISSVMAQHYQAWELLLIDDGSADGSLEVLREWASRDSRIRVITSGHAGVAAARNLGLAAAKGQLLAFLDSDNSWEPDYLELMVVAMQYEGVDIAYSAVELQLEDGVAYRAFSGGREYLKVLNHIDLNVLMVSTSALADVTFDESLRRWVDHAFVLRLTRTHDAVLMPFIGCRYDDRRSSIRRITTTESENWQWASVADAWVDWDDARNRLESRCGDRVSVVIPVYNQHERTVHAVRSVLATTSQLDVEVILVDNGSNLATMIRIRAVFAGDDRVVVIRLPRNLNFAIGSNVGAVFATGDRIMFLNNDTEVQSGWLEPLLERIEAPDVLGVQPLLQFPDNSIQSAGCAFVADDTVPVAFLAGQPPEDGLRVGDLRFSAITAAAVLCRARDFLAVDGFDPVFVNGMEDVDLCLRLRDARPGYFVVEPRSRVRHWESISGGRFDRVSENRALFLRRWRGRLPPPDEALFAAVDQQIGQLTGDGLPLPTPILNAVRRAGALERWGIRYAAVGGADGDLWGDTAFVESLADALRAHGREVVTYRHGANARGSACLDDVNLVIRGVDRVAPVPGRINVLWVISHPEDVSVTELGAFDLVFAASESWARTMTELAGRPVIPLLQATDASRFHPPTGDVIQSRPSTFVGSVHPGRRRGTVEDAVAAAIPLAVIGRGWGARLPDTVLERDFVANHELPEVYWSATRVLADHWPEMARDGFIQNRLFDAVASGARVISDPVPGLEALFQGAVQAYSSIEHLRFLASPEGLVAFPSDESLRQIAESVVLEHSFDARAEALIENVERVRRQRVSRMASFAPRADVVSDQTAPAPLRTLTTAETEE